MSHVTLSFEGDDADAMAERFYVWLVDGGLEDEVVDTLSTETQQVSIDHFDNDARSVRFLITPR